MAGQSTLKRPAAHTSASSRKRPAAAAGSMTSTLNELRKGVRGKEKDAKGSNDASKKDESSSSEEDDPDDGEDGEGNKRSKGKGLKFAQMKDKLPPHIVELYEKGALEKASPRAFRTQIVNTLFKRTKQGRYVLKADRPLFEEAKKIYEKKWGNERQKSYPRSVLKGLFFANSEPALQAALDCGDVYVVPSSGSEGKELYAFQTEEVGWERQGFRELF